MLPEARTIHMLQEVVAVLALYPELEREWCERMDRLLNDMENLWKN